MADLSQAESAARVLEAALDRYGDVDILINNAGLVRDRMSFNLSSEDWELVVAVNLSASFYLARAAAQHWKGQLGAEDGQKRVIVNTSSESGLYGNAGQANYAAAKAGVAALTLTLAAELERYGIRVNAIAPRARTLMSVAAFGDLPETPAYDPFAPEHVAAVIAWLASDAARDVSGQVLVIHGGSIEVMRTWSPLRRVWRRGDWTDTELLMLRDQLFPQGGTRYIAPSIRDLFVSCADGKE